MPCQPATRAMWVGTPLMGVALWLAIAAIKVQAAPDSYGLTRYTAEQGLPENTIRALLQTRDGYLWIGTLAGLARFDGLRFKTYDRSNTPEMLSDAINALAEDRQDGSLWINSGRGLLRYHEHRFERFDTEDGFPQPYGPMWPARQGGLWYSPHPGHLVRLDTRTVRTWELRPRRVSGDGDEIVGHRITRVLEEEDGSVLVLMHIGLFRFLPETGVCERLGLRGATDTSCRHFYRELDGTVYMAAREGLWRLAGNAGERIESVAPDDPQCPALLHPSRDGGFWVAWSEDGPPRLARFHDGASGFLDLSALPDYPLLSFCEDAEGHLWLGTTSGLCQLRRRAVRVYAREDGLRNDFVRAVTEGPDGTIWLGTVQGASGLRNGQATNLPPIEPPSNWGWAEGLLADRHGRVWYGAMRNTVAVLDRGAWISVPSLSLGESWVRTLREDRSGRIWVGFDRGVLWLDEEGAVRTLPCGLSHPDVRVIHQDRRGDVWFGTSGGGLNRLRDAQVTSYTTARGEYNNRVWCIHEDADGIFWIATRDGLNRFVPPEVSLPTHSPSQWEDEGGGSRFFTFTKQHGLYENTIQNVQEDDFGYLWLSGLQGIYRVARRDLNEVAAGRQGRVQVLAFGEADGMLNSQCTGMFNQASGCKDREGRIWFPTARGVAMIDPRAIRRNEVAPLVVIEQVVADDEVVFGDGCPSSAQAVSDGADAQAQRSTLPGGSARPTFQTSLGAGRGRVIEMRYTAASFAAPKRVRFKYRLEGSDRDWRYDEDNQRVAFYTRLGPGGYAFRVAACNNHGVWSEQPAVFAFTIAPHFWQTWLFYVLCAAAVIGLAGAIQAYRLRWQRRLLNLEQQQTLADERTRIARDLHDDLGTALTGLALQMDVLSRDAHGTPTWANRLAESAAGIRTLAARMREVVWAVNPRCDTVSSLAAFLEQQAGHFLRSAPLRCRLDFPDAVPPLPLDAETRHALALAVREALTNVVRHANASEVVLGLRVESGRLIVRVADNGQGFLVAERVGAGQGLANMRSRLEKIRGECRWRSTPGGGTSVEMNVPLPDGGGSQS
ncbi:MAG TPA: two-component regulator propeller domain-containing protein [Candidatus Paceibacterota bacterium]|nr:two-component regulator propeller domain-containing protein [Candidatus Paceibacterota bacterium]